MGERRRWVAPASFLPSVHRACGPCLHAPRGLVRSCAPRDLGPVPLRPLPACGGLPAAGRPRSALPGRALCLVRPKSAGPSACTCLSPSLPVTRSDRLPRLDSAACVPPVRSLLPCFEGRVFATGSRAPLDRPEGLPTVSLLDPRAPAAGPGPTAFLRGPRLPLSSLLAPARRWEPRCQVRASPCLGPDRPRGVRP